MKRGEWSDPDKKINGYDVGIEWAKSSSLARNKNEREYERNGLTMKLVQEITAEKQYLKNKEWRGTRPN